MAEWIQIDSNLPTKPEVRRIVRKTNEDTATVIGRLLIFWSQIDQHGDLLDEAERPDGRPDLDGIIPDYELDDLLDICGGDEAFWNVVAETGWLAFDNRGLLFPGFDKRFSVSSKRRMEAARRKQRQRARDTGVIGTTPRSPEPKTEKARPKKSKTPDVTDVTQERDTNVTPVTRKCDQKRVKRESDEREESQKEKDPVPAEPRLDATLRTTAAGDRGKKDLPWQFVTDRRLKSAVTNKDPTIIETLYREAIAAGWLTETPTSRHRFYSAVCYGTREPSVESVKGLLTYRLKKNDWRTGTNDADDEAKKLIRIADGTDRPRVSNLDTPAEDLDRKKAEACASLKRMQQTAPQPVGSPS